MPLSDPQKFQELQNQLKSKDAEITQLKAGGGAPAASGKKGTTSSSDLIQDLNSQITKYKGQIQKQKDEIGKIRILKKC